jgi:hypothetical protein
MVYRTIWFLDWFDGVQRDFQQYFSDIVVVSYIAAGNRKSLTNFIT